ncbi:MAG TPA: DUF4345 family protein [Vicinamibacterales bacterium]|nr:DUF4345 family protein [Vicinamibacterales bacterium]
MTLWRLILAVIALSYAGFGFAFLFKPDEWGALVSVAFTTSAGRTDFRAVYGGLEFGVGVFLFLCALRREFVRLGLFASACALIAMATARSTGMLLDGFDVLQFFIVLSEWLGGAIATYGAVVAKPERDAVPTPLQDPTPNGPTAL